jgi:hypothetical protein
MDTPGNRDISIFNFFSDNTIDYLKFSDGTFTADQIKSKVQWRAPPSTGARSATDTGDVWTGFESPGLCLFSHFG